MDVPDARVLRAQARREDRQRAGPVDGAERNDRAAGLPALEWRERGRNSSGGRGRCHCRRGKSRLSAQNGRLAHPRPRRPSGF
jgi:hypothetical protein